MLSAWGLTSIQAEQQKILLLIISLQRGVLGHISEWSELEGKRTSWWGRMATWQKQAPQVGSRKRKTHLHYHKEQSVCEHNSKGWAVVTKAWKANVHNSSSEHFLWVRSHRCYHSPHNDSFLSHFTDEETEALTAASAPLPTMIQPQLPSIHFRTETPGLEQFPLHCVQEETTFLPSEPSHNPPVPSGSPQVWYKPVKTQIAAIHTQFCSEQSSVNAESAVGQERAVRSINHWSLPAPIRVPAGKRWHSYWGV